VARGLSLLTSEESVFAIDIAISEFLLQNLKTAITFSTSRFNHYCLSSKIIRLVIKRAIGSGKVTAERQFVTEELYELSSSSNMAYGILSPEIVIFKTQNLKFSSN
jgi:hypothetical protein